jgi:hypothetical protein
MHGFGRKTAGSKPGFARVPTWFRPLESGCACDGDRWRSAAIGLAVKGAGPHHQLSLDLRAWNS